MLVFPKIGGKPPKWMVKISWKKNTMNKWMIWGVFPLFLVQHPNVLCFGWVVQLPLVGDAFLFAQMCLVFVSKEHPLLPNLFRAMWNFVFLYKLQKERFEVHQALAFGVNHLSNISNCSTRTCSNPSNWYSSWLVNQPTPNVPTSEIRV